MSRNRNVIITGPRISLTFIAITWTQQGKGHVPVLGMAHLSRAVWLISKKASGMYIII
jgi:hypothetical protein